VNGFALAVRQLPYQNKAFWRNPASAFFTFVFPLMFLVIFTTLLGGGNSVLPNGELVSTSTYYTASILAFSVITACYTNVAISVTFLREEGVLKRVRGTPLPGWAYLLAKVIHSIFVMVILVAIVCAFGLFVYDVKLPTHSLPAFVATLLIGSAAFCALGLACTAVTPNADAAPAITNATMLPLLFISGVFIPLDQAPAWMKTLGDLFPVKHFLQAATEAFIPPPGNSAGWLPRDLLIVAAWGAAALFFAARRFRWEPRR
jgi:ABC-2 type transport system permease protein